MGIPQWLKKEIPDGSRVNSLRFTRYAFLKNRSERFLDKTLHYALSFIEDTMFNESISTRDGLLQTIEPRLKIMTSLFFVVALSLQKSVAEIALFSFLALSMVSVSKIPLYSFLKKLLPAFTITVFISIPVILNLIVEGEHLFVLHRFNRSINIGPVFRPKEIALTKQGLNSAMTLLLRVLTSVSFVFLTTMTTQPNTFIKALSSLIPGSLKSVVSISYRYIFFLVRKIERFIMGLKSRRLSVIKPERGRRWIASRIGLLFSVSMELSNELAMAMESRGYRQENFKSQITNFKFSKKDILWLIFTILFCGGMIWKSLA